MKRLPRTFVSAREKSPRRFEHALFFLFLVERAGPEPVVLFFSFDFRSRANESATKIPTQPRVDSSGSPPPKVSAFRVRASVHAELLCTRLEVRTPVPFVSILSHERPTLFRVYGERQPLVAKTSSTRVSARSRVSRPSSTRNRGKPVRLHRSEERRTWVRDRGPVVGKQIFTAVPVRVRSI